MEELTLVDYLAILKWRKKYFFITFSVLWVITLVFALCWSNYRSTATVEIEQPQVAADATAPIGSNPNDVQEALADLRIGKIQQKVTAPASLVDIISKFDLYPSARKLEPIGSIANRMGSKVRLNLIGSTVANPAATSKVSVSQLSAIAFTVSFDYSDPHNAQQVTNELVTRFLDEDLKERRAQAEATSEFLAAQITTLEASMADQEKKISEFQQAHGISKPEALMFNQQAAATSLMSLQSLDSQIASNEGAQGSLRAQLATVDPYSRVIADGQMLTTPAIQLKALEAQYTTLTAQYGPNHPDVVKTRHQIEALRQETGLKGGVDTAPLKAQISDLRTNLAAAQKTGGSNNPDVVALKHQLEKLETQLASAGKGGSSHSAIKQDADNPAYLQFVAQLTAAEEQHKALLAQREALAKQQAKYQLAVTENPGLEQQMASLSRDYDNSQLRYREIREKKMSADMDLQMIQERKGARLLVINPPDLPMKTSPSRLLILLGGFLLSIMAGIGSVVLVQSINRNILGARHLTALIGIAPLVTIPHIFTATETSRVHRRRPLAIAAAIFLTVMGATLFNFEVMPLDVLWSIFAQRLGLS